MAIDIPDGELIHSQRSPLQQISIYQSGTLRLLRTDSLATQSAIDLAHPHTLLLPYMSMMLAHLLFQPPPRRCLLLGLGGGDLVRYLHHQIPGCKITAVELDAEIVNISQRYFALPDANNIELVVEDAAHFIATHRRPVDTLLVDLYSHNGGMPALLQEDGFYHDCYRALSRSGVMAINLLIHHPQELHTILRKIRQRFQQLTLCLTVAGYKNVIVLAFRHHPTHLDKASLLQRAAELSPQFELSFEQMVENLFLTNPLAGGELFF